MLKGIKIVIGPSTFAATDIAPAHKLIEKGFDVTKNPFGRKLTKEELIKLLPGAQGLIAGLETLDREVLKGSVLKVISRCGAGVENIDFKAAQEMGIKVYSTPDAPAGAVAELTVSAMLALLRPIARMDKDMHEGKWKKDIGGQLSGKTVAIIGFGRIGRRVAKLLRGFDVNITAVDPNVNPAEPKSERVKYAALSDALPGADIVTLHVDGDSEILGDREFGMMKRGVFLLNSSRGIAVKESALVSGIIDGRIAGAWCDSFVEEPYAGPLTKFGNVLLTPHVGSYTRECRSRMEMEAVDNLIKGFSA